MKRTTLARPHSSSMLVDREWELTVTLPDGREESIMKRTTLARARLLQYPEKVGLLTLQSSISC